MISRHWGAIVKRELASAYVAHLKSETFPAIRRIEGFVDATINRPKAQAMMVSFDARVRHFEIVE
jgi:hypothetical protein